MSTPNAEGLLSVGVYGSAPLPLGPRSWFRQPRSWFRSPGFGARLLLPSAAFRAGLPVPPAAFRRSLPVPPATFRAGLLVPPAPSTRRRMLPRRHFSCSARPKVFCTAKMRRVASRPCFDRAEQDFLRGWLSEDAARRDEAPEMKHTDVTGSATWNQAVAGGYGRSKTMRRAASYSSRRPAAANSRARTDGPCARTAAKWRSARSMSSE